MKVLVVDRDCEYRKDIHSVLNLCLPDIKLIEADSGEQCLAMVKHSNPDIVVLSLKLSGMVCFDIIQKIRRFSIVPIVMISNNKKEVELAKILALGADDYLDINKSVKPVELGGHINKLVMAYKGKEINRACPAGETRVSYRRTVRLN